MKKESIRTDQELRARLLNEFSQFGHVSNEFSKREKMFLRSLEECGINPSLMMQIFDKRKHELTNMHLESFGFRDENQKVLVPTLKLMHGTFKVIMHPDNRSPIYFEPLHSQLLADAGLVSVRARDQMQKRAQLRKASGQHIDSSTNTLIARRAWVDPKVVLLNETHTEVLPATTLGEIGQPLEIKSPQNLPSNFLDLDKHPIEINVSHMYALRPDALVRLGVFYTSPHIHFSMVSPGESVTREYRHELEIDPDKLSSLARLEYPMQKIVGPNETAILAYHFWNNCTPRQ